MVKIWQKMKKILVQKLTGMSRPLSRNGSVKEAGEFSLNPNQSKEQKNAFSGNKSILIKLFVIMIMLIIVLACI